MCEVVRGRRDGGEREGGREEGGARRIRTKGPRLGVQRTRGGWGSRTHGYQYLHRAEAARPAGRRAEVGLAKRREHPDSNKYLEGSKWWEQVSHTLANRHSFQTTGHGRRIEKWLEHVRQRRSIMTQRGLQTSSHYARNTDP